jgi:hypothetical protein
MIPSMKLFEISLQIRHLIELYVVKAPWELEGVDFFQTWTFFSLSVPLRKSLKEIISILLVGIDSNNSCTDLCMYIINNVNLIITWKFNFEDVQF